MNDKLLGPIQWALCTVLKQRGDLPLFNPSARQSIVLLADSCLIKEFPVARLVSADLRRKSLTEVLDRMVPASAASAAGRAPLSLPGEPSAAAPLRLESLPPTALPAVLPGDSFQGFLITPEDADKAAIRAAVQKVLGTGWELEEVAGTLHATNPDAQFGVTEAFEKARALQQEPAVREVEPNLLLPDIAALPDQPALERQLAAQDLRSNPAYQQSAVNPEWSIQQVKADRAWAYSEAQNRPSGGFGIRIGHPDTGVAPHTENWGGTGAQPKILLDLGVNFYDPQKTGGKPIDPLDAGTGDAVVAGFPPINGHGTGTSSIIVSPAGPPTGAPDGKDHYVSGTAPRAQLVPIRVLPTVVVWDQGRLARGILHAVGQKCHVISMSMGGLPLFFATALHNAVLTAVEQGIIVCAAAGNYFGASNLFPEVVYPAHFDEVIACAACNILKRPWTGSSRGAQVNITAPGEFVWHAAANRPDTLDGEQRHSHTVCESAGTSFAVATVAGLAACWLAHHGVDELARHYGHTRYIPRAFAWLLRHKAFQVDPQLPAGLFGTGIIDGEQLLREALPSKTELLAWPSKGGAATRAAIPVPIAAATSVHAFALQNGHPDNQASFIHQYGPELQHHLYYSVPVRQALSAAVALPEAARAPGAPLLQESSEPAREALHRFTSPELAETLAKLLNGGTGQESSGIL